MSDVGCPYCEHEHEQKVIGNYEEYEIKCKRESCSKNFIVHVEYCPSFEGLKKKCLNGEMCDMTDTRSCRDVSGERYRECNVCKNKVIDA
tara:strand:- start:1541 stop:1810 length:270 start_codon:yes stop_codon:yes gene_type:complete